MKSLWDLRPMWRLKVVLYTLLLATLACFLIRKLTHGLISDIGQTIVVEFLIVSFAIELIQLLINWVKRIGTISKPLNAEFLFYVFLDAKHCDALVGDLEERYKLVRKKFGVRKANVWYWTQATRSIGPIAWAWAKKTALKPMVGIVTWAVTKGLLGHDSWITALVEIWKKIRS